MAPVRVLVADDDQLFRTALVDLIRTDPSMEVVGEASGSEEAVRVAAETRPDVVLLDVRMPGGGGQEAARRIAEMNSDTVIVALTAQEDQKTVLEMLRSGALGYLVKGTPGDEVLRAIGAAAAGEAVLSPRVTAGVIKTLLQLLDRAETVTRELEEIDRAKSELIQILAHELRTPITVITGTVDMLSQHRNRLTAEQAAEFWGSLSRASTRIERVANNAATAAKLSFQGSKASTRRVSVRDLVDKCLAGLGDTGKRLRVEASIEDLTARVLAAEDLSVALRALMENAVDFSPEDKSIDIQVSADPDRVTIMVLDRGPGIPDSMKDRIFESFTQVDSSDSRPHEGLGMGLFVASQIARAHRGRIDLRDRPGGGSVFILELPRAD